MINTNTITLTLTDEQRAALEWIAKQHNSDDLGATFTHLARFFLADLVEMAALGQRMTDEDRADYERIMAELDAKRIPLPPGGSGKALVDYFIKNVNPEDWEGL